MDNASIDHRDFYHEQKWCGQCQTYVRYLMSVNRSYCIDCGSQVRLFSKEDAMRFSNDLEKRKWKAS
ncbi:MAG: hypothetical protein AAF628_06935 [Planctomycetota bacterium]